MRLSRRKLFERAAGAAAFGAAFKFVDRPANGAPLQAGGVNKNSAPSQLRITDMRAIRVASNYDYPIIKIDTNQGVCGLGEVRDAGVEGTALMLKPHIVGKNPLDIEPILDSVRNFATQPHGRRVERARHCLARHPPARSTACRAGG